MNQPLDNLTQVQQSFTAQAQNFETGSMNFSKQEYLDYTVRCARPQAGDNVLEAAAGTGLCGRALAPHVQSVTCLDATPAMLAVGERAARSAGLTNLRFVQGRVEQLPFAKETFDLVLTRLAFHHFTEMERPMAELCRVLKPGGRLVTIDMEAAAEPLRAVEDRLETLRDPSHVKNRSRQEFLSLFAAQGLTLTKAESTPIEVSVPAWLELTDTPDDAAQRITALLRAELAGGQPTGFSPYERDGRLWFAQRWLLMVCHKAG
ncbi:MAG: class I SAM-dependent methyltransferase [Eubacteriales bacterium]|nr:class I SAM-dependent methyltransferase [Eubacteriales bacterium]